MGFKRSQITITMDGYSLLNNLTYQQMCRDEGKEITSMKVTGLNQRVFRSFLNENNVAVYVQISQDGPPVNAFAVDRKFMRWCRLCRRDHLWDIRDGNALPISIDSTEDLIAEPCQHWVIDAMAAEGINPYGSKSSE